MNSEPYELVQKSVKASADRELTNHVLTVEGPNEWRVAKPGTGIWAYHVLCRPDMVAVWGDLGEWILRPHRSDGLPWLRGSVNSPDYLLSKITAVECLGFYEAEALALLDDPPTAEDWGVETVEKIRESVKSYDHLTREKWLDACYDAGLDDPPLVGYPTRSALVLVELLRKFVGLEEAV